MSTQAGRKKSTTSTSGPFIDSPIANNTLLNKAASQSTSLYQQCSALRSRLLRLPLFSEWFNLALPPESSSRRSADPVTQLWDCFILGVPLCYLFNLLPPPFAPIDINTDPSSFDVANEKHKKRAIALFSMSVKQIEGCEQFTVTELWDRNSTDGFVKVVNNVIELSKHLPEDAFMDVPPMSPQDSISAQESTDSLLSSDTSLVTTATESEGPRFNIIKELVETERKYVQDLEVMQRYSMTASQTNIIDQDTIHLLFPGLNKLLNFQRKFLIKLEGTAEMPWNEQRWGVLFTENEDEFAVYEPYCANYTSASEIMLQEEHNLVALNHVIQAKGELPAFLIKPVQRICKYPLLLESLLKAVSGTDYPYIDELKAGVASAKRITDRINEAQRRAENNATVRNLESRVEDWKGHHISNFGYLLLDDVFSVTKSEVDREYHVFLFEKIILCCKESLTPVVNGRKMTKSNSILKKPASPAPAAPSGAGSSKKKSTPLLLKGRIFLNNVTQAVPKITAGQYSLAVWWRGDDDLEFFTLRCRNEEQLKMWESQLNRLIQETANRRTSDRNMQRLAQAAMNPISVRQAPSAFNERTMSMFSQSTSHSNASPYQSGVPVNLNGRHPYSGEDQGIPVPVNGHSNGPQGYPPYDGFDVDDEYEDYPPVNGMPPQGRATPLGTRRPDVNTSVAPYGSARNSQHAVSPSLPFSNGPSYPQSPYPSTARPSISRNVSSFASDPNSFGPGVVPSRGTLRSQFSSTRLRSAYDQNEPSSRQSGHGPFPGGVGLPSMRSRSASQPSAYNPNANSAPPPPLPTSTIPWADRSQSVLGANKRGSGSSQSTGDSSDYSPKSSSSPITPYGSSDSSLTGIAGARPPRAQPGADVLTDATAGLKLMSLVKVKVHFNEDIFVIQVPRMTDYDELVEKVGKKIRLCGPRRDDGPLRVKYKDEDGDLVSLGSTEDVQMAFETFGPGNQVTLYVQ